MLVKDIKQSLSPPPLSLLLSLSVSLTPLCVAHQHAQVPLCKDNTWAITIYHGRHIDKAYWL